MTYKTGIQSRSSTGPLIVSHAGTLSQIKPDSGIAQHHADGNENSRHQCNRAKRAWLSLRAGSK
jgi:hypothetical protein